ncbi:NADPH-dependent oxidoreductase [Paludibacter sp. 221]|uniref:NADPH-dependent oxidoreductase n=1 Tax=Paludibacter sp. 221 TaxID=2302939 RepID=UPI0013D037FD|nr:NADPH-dependent oxidoreductase [Paludibacter sp. 221]NDV45438.1 NADPH-dependent oxidoreductase [Paludibacter sp. 221]
MLDFLNQHRSIRKYTDKVIDAGLMNQLLEAACRTSNTGNMQAYSVVVTTGDEIKRQLAPTHFNQPMVVQAPAVLTFCADFNRFTKWCGMRRADAGYDNFQSFMTTAIDVLLASQTFAIAAEAEGLGICYLGTTTYNAGEIIDILKLPKLVVPITTITVGYPAEIPEQTDRLPLDAVVHYEQYKDYTTEDINSLYAEKENSAFYKNFVAENNKETLAQVFTDIRYPRKNNEVFSDKFLEVLKKQGFL